MRSLLASSGGNSCWRLRFAGLLLLLVLPLVGVGSVGAVADPGGPQAPEQEPAPVADPPKADQAHDSGPAPSRRKRPAEFRKAALIGFEGPIDYRLQKYFQDRLARARRSGADLVIVEIDSPGGLKTVSLEIAEQLRDVDWAHTVAWVPKEAISGGALVALGCDEIIAHPAMRFGDIGEIQFDTEFWAFRLVPAKVQSVLVRQARDLATAKGRPPELAEALIDKDVQVFTSRDKDGRLRYQTVRVGTAPPDGDWTLIEESGPERFLTVNGDRGLEIGLIEGVVDDRDQLLAELAVPAGALTVYRRTAGDAILYLLNTPWLTALLIIAGVLALYLELSAPGIGVGALVAGLCAVLFFGSRFLGGTAGWLEITLFLAGVLFLAMELFVIPGWGVSGLAGIGLVTSSAILASQSFVIPSTPDELNQTLTTLVVLVASGCVVMIGAAWITRRFGSLPVFRQLVLVPQTSDGSGRGSGSGDKPDKAGPVPHPLVSVGDWGRTESPLRPSGRVRFAGRSIDVVSDGSYVETGENVRVIAIRGSIVTVAPVIQDEA